MPDIGIASPAAFWGRKRRPISMTQIQDMTHHGMGRTEDACATLARFGRQFPDAAPASQARAARESVRANCR